MIPFVEGFDYYPAITGVTGVAGRWTLNNTASTSLTTGRFGDGQALFSSPSTSQFLTRAIPSTNTIACGVAIRISDASEVNAARRLIEFRNASGPQCGVGINASGEIIAYRSTTATVLGTASGVTFSDTVWHYIEVEAFVHDSTGFINVYKDGTQILAVSGVDTRQQTADTITFFRLYGTDGTGAQPNVFAWDDVYVTDQATRLGECRVKTLYPNGATADADWTPSGGGDNYQQVDEAQVDGDTTYVASDTPGDLDFYTMTDLGFAPDTVHAVQLTMSARKDDAETRAVRLKLKSGAVVEDGATQAMAGSYQYFSDVYEEDPDVVGPWTASSVNAMQIGIETVT
jgi:hypothetical protein